MNPSDPRSRPNLFSFATSELSQDAFLAYLLAWSDSAYQEIDPAMHGAAHRFLELLFAGHEETLPEIHDLQIHRQFKHADLLIVLNGNYAILIEDKTYTAEHSGQLNKYKKEVEAAFPACKLLPIYYKIMEQSNLQQVLAAGYLPVTRQQMIALMEDGPLPANTIYLDYLHHLKTIQRRVSAYLTTPVAEWDHWATQGFFHALQQELPGSTWGYVPNASGGFFALWMHPFGNLPVYLQLENTAFCVRAVAENKEERRELRDHWSSRFLQYAASKAIPLSRPKRMGNGATMTIAVNQDYTVKDDHGILKWDDTVTQIKQWIETLKGI